MAEFGLTTEMLDFNIDDFSVEELREKFEALKTTGSEPAANAGNPESFALEGQFRDELFGALESEKVETCCSAPTKCCAAPALWKRSHRFWTGARTCGTRSTKTLT